MIDADELAVRRFAPANPRSTRLSSGSARISCKLTERSIVRASAIVFAAARAPRPRRITHPRIAELTQERISAALAGDAPLWSSIPAPLRERP